MSKESARPVEILTEEELNLKKRAFSTGVMPTWEFDQVIDSHRELFKEYDLYKTIALEFVTEQTARKIYGLLRSGQ